MPRKLTLNVETLAELTSGEMSAVVGGAGSESCSCTIANVCINTGGARDVYTAYIDVAIAGC